MKQTGHHHNGTESWKKKDILLRCSYNLQAIPGLCRVEVHESCSWTSVTHEALDQRNTNLEREESFVRDETKFSYMHSPSQSNFFFNVFPSVQYFSCHTSFVFFNNILIYVKEACTYPICLRYSRKEAASKWCIIVYEQKMTSQH